MTRIYTSKTVYKKTKRPLSNGFIQENWLSVSESTVTKINILQKRLLPNLKKEESKFKQTQLVFLMKNEKSAI